MSRHDDPCAICGAWREAHDCGQCPPELISEPATFASKFPAPPRVPREYRDQCADTRPPPKRRGSGYDMSDFGDRGDY